MIWIKSAIDFRNNADINIDSFNASIPMIETDHAASYTTKFL